MTKENEQNNMQGSGQQLVDLCLLADGCISSLITQVGKIMEAREKASRENSGNLMLRQGQDALTSVENLGKILAELIQAKKSVSEMLHEMQMSFGNKIEASVNPHAESKGLKTLSNENR